MKVILIADDFSVETGTGIARYAKELLTGLSNKGIYVKLICVEPPKVPFGGTINHTFRLPYHVLKEANNFDLLHATSPASAFSFPLIEKAKKIVTYHDLTSFLCKEADFPLHARLFNPFVYKNLAKYSDRIIAVSTQTKEDLVNHLKIPIEKIAVVNLGVDEKFKPAEKEERDYFVIGYLGALAARKRVDYLIGAFYYLKKKHAEFEIKLCICGKKTQDYSKLVKLAKDLNLKLDKDIELRGFVQDEKLVEVYNSFDVFVLPSGWEGFGIPILEAQRCGVPVIVRQNAYIPREVTKYCVKAKSEEDMARKIYELLTNSSLRDDIIKKGLEYSKQFTWGKTVSETIKVYEEIL
ncbi:glycosyltransferase family 1 protein [Methanophagales archaeon]|nr:MAG: glycosyltransferase family 1 protein [Methanophagales archaeon]